MNSGRFPASWTPPRWPSLPDLPAITTADLGPEQCPTQARLPHRHLARRLRRQPGTLLHDGRTELLGRWRDPRGPAVPAAGRGAPLARELDRGWDDASRRPC